MQNLYFFQLIFVVDIGLFFIAKLVYIYTQIDLKLI